MSGFVAAVVDFARAHEYLAYGLVFFLAMSEALPVVGAFMPGTAIIIGLSALVPSGALHLWPLIVCTTVGAIAGDGLSYWLRHRYRREITERWPLNRYPELIARGDALVRRHGGKSVFIARFTPGVRAIVPVIAGILLMSPARFYSMNVLSALVWAPSHILAGALIGASLALLGAVAGRLAVLLVVVVAILWAVAWATRRLLRRLPSWIGRTQERLLAWARRRDSWMSRQVLSLLDPARKELQGLAVLGAVTVGGLWVFFGILEDVISGDPLVRADAAVFHFLQSLRSIWIDQAMVAVTELGDVTVTTAVTVVALLWFAWRRAWRAAIYCVTAVLTAGVFTLLLQATPHVLRPAEIDSGGNAISFLGGRTTVNAALYAFLAILVAWELAPRWRPPVALAVALFVAAIAFSRLYLGTGWISDVTAGLAFGVAWAAFLSIAYLRRNPAPVRAGGLCAAAVLTLAVVGGIHIDRQHAGDMARYAVRGETRTMPVAAWWQQGWSELPAHRVDLGGEFEEPVTVQWAGGLDALTTQLTAKGWRVPVGWTLQSALAWLAPHVSLEELPVLPRLANGHREALVMVMVQAADDKASGTRLVLRLWRSDVDLKGDSIPEAPLWIGTVVEERMESLMSVLTVTRALPNLNTPREVLASVVDPQRQVERGAADHETGWDGVVLLGHDPSLHDSRRRALRAPRRRHRETGAGTQAGSGESRSSKHLGTAHVPATFYHALGVRS